MNGGHQERLWGVLWMIHTWETVLPKQYWTMPVQDVREEKHHAKTPGAKLKINGGSDFPCGGKCTSANLCQGLSWVWKVYLESWEDSSNPTGSLNSWVTFGWGNPPSWRQRGRHHMHLPGRVFFLLETDPGLDRSGSGVCRLLFEMLPCGWDGNPRSPQPHSSWRSYTLVHKMRDCSSTNPQIFRISSETDGLHVAHHVGQRSCPLYNFIVNTSMGVKTQKAFYMEKVNKRFS